MTFKHLTIYLEGPICDCEYQDLSVISFLSFFKGKKRDPDPETGNDKTPPT